MNRKRMYLAPVAAAALAALFSSGASALEFHGYIRSGAGTTEGKGNQQCFQLPGAYSKYRLGNECETYGEVGLDQNLYDGKDGVKFDYHLMFAFVGPYSSQQDFENLNTDGRQWANRQNWIEVKNLPFLNGGSVWGGKRYYKRNDVHITDFYYWDTSGYGVGVENVPAGPVKVSYAFFRNTIDNNTAMSRHDLRAEGLSLGAAGSLDFGLNVNQGSTNAGTTAENGTAVTVQHFIGNLWGGFNKVALQYGTGSTRNLVFPYPEFGAGSSKKTWRITEQIQVQLSPAWSGMATFVYQDQKDNYKWTSIGVRPVYHISDYFKIQAEFGYDQVKPVGEDTRKLAKATIAPTLVAGRGFWARPELRLFYTYAKWNDPAIDGWGGVAGGSAGRFGGDKNGNTAGFQIEAWF